MINHAYGSLVGLAIGDAMGMPASFMTPKQIEERYGRITDFMVPHDEQKAHQQLKKGEVTDDTQECLIISSVLIEKGFFDEETFIAKMREWAITHKMLDSTVIGPSTRRFLESIIEGRDYRIAGRMGDTNGGAMRVAPIGIFYHGELDQAIDNAILSALPSHGSKPGVASTAAIAGAIAMAMKENITPKEVMEAAVYAARKGEEAGYDIPAPSVADRIQWAMELVEQHNGKSVEEICYLLYRYIGAGMKSYESIPFSLGVFYASYGRFEEGILAAINIGDDADTNGAIVGSLCGAFQGIDGIKKEWIEKIEAQNQLSLRKIAQLLIEKR